MISSKLMSVLEKVMFGCLLNILWFVGGILGLVLFGVGPSTYALAKTITKKELFADQSSLFQVTRVFFKEYKNNFLKSNSVFLVFLVYLLILGINLRIILTNQVLLSIFLLPIILMIVYGVSTLLSSLVVSIYAEGTTREKIKLTLMSPVLVPSVFLFNLIYLSCILLVCYIMPISIFLISVTGLVGGVMVINLKKFKDSNLVIDIN